MWVGTPDRFSTLDVTESLAVSAGVGSVVGGCRVLFIGWLVWDSKGMVEAVHAAWWQREE